MRKLRLKDFAVFLIVFYCFAVLFNLLVGSYSWLPDHRWDRLFLPVPEALAALLLLLGISRIRSPLGYRSLLILLSGVYLLLFVYNLGQSFFLYVYRRDFDPFTSMTLVPEFFSMVFRSELFKGPFFIGAVSVLAGTLLGGFFFLVFSLARRLFARTEVRTAGFVFPAAIPAVIVFLVLFYPSPVLTGVLFRKLAAGPAAFTEDLTLPGAELRTTGPGPEYGFPGIEDADIYLFVIESYGHTIFTNPHHYRRLAEVYRETAGKLTGAGFSAYTTVYDSTTFGGTSWLADASLLTGIEVDTQAKFNTVLKKGTRNLLHILEEGGYSSIYSSPATNVMLDDHKRFYTFSRYVLHEDFGYAGPYFTLGKMPDQFQLNYVRTTVLPELESPRFVQFMLASSHVPWNYIPPVIEDWNTIDDGNIYYDRSKNTYYENSWAIGSELFEGYAHSIRYVLEVITDYLVTYLTGDELIVLVGDHQPKFPVSEKEASFGVPLHLISRNEDFLKTFTRFGYASGLIPREADGFYGLESFLGHFLHAAKGTVRGLAPRGKPVGIPRSPYEVQ